jgi:hypothetical protein
MLDNPRLLVQKLMVQPGQAMDLDGASGDQLWVFVRGGTLTTRTGRATVWRDGRVMWKDAGTTSDLDGGVNGGAAPIELILVTLVNARAGTCIPRGFARWRSWLDADDRHQRGP